LIGPNGAGKSTLLQILAGRIRPDAGDLAVRKRTRLSYVSQHSEFAAGQTVKFIVEDAMERSMAAEADRSAVIAESLGRAGFMDSLTTPASGSTCGRGKVYQMLCYRLRIYFFGARVLTQA